MRISACSYSIIRAESVTVQIASAFRVSVNGKRIKGAVVETVESVVVTEAGLVGRAQNTLAVEPAEHACHDDADGGADVQIKGYLALGPSDLSLKLLGHPATVPATPPRLKTPLRSYRENRDGWESVPFARA
jgi:hypothetical protein